MKRMCCGEYTCVHRAIPFLGRFLISLIFILAGLGKIFDFQGAVNLMKSVGIQEGEVYIIIGLIIELLGGILLLLGLFTRFAVVLLMIFLFPTTLIFHGFWNYSGQQLALQLSIFLKNLAIYGGLLAYFSFGAGLWSLDACRSGKEVCK